jgi:hypothetical protein
MDNKKYSVIYYDVENTDLDYLVELSDQIKAFHEKENIHFLLLPTTVKQEWISKDELLEQLKEMVKEVESWE